jgi:predicted PurR-regulated permease PerM
LVDLGATISSMIDSDPATHRSEAVRWSIRGLGFAIGAIVVVGGLAALFLAWRVAVVVFLSILLGSALAPLLAHRRDHIPVPRGLAILIIYATVFVVVGVLAFIFLPGVISEADDIAGRLPSALTDIEAWAQGLQPEIIGNAVTALADAIRASVLQARPPRAEDIVGAGVTVAEALVTTITVFALVYFWITERARLQRYATAFLPIERRAGAREAWNDIELRLGGWVRGQLVLMGTIAVATGAAYWLLGLPSALLLGLIAGLAELIPLVGPALGAVPALVVAAALRPDLLVPVAIVYVVIHLVEGNLLVPVVMRNSVGISPFVVIVSLLVGGALAGLLGALIAVPVAACVVVVLERLQVRDVPVALDQTAAVDEAIDPDGSIDGSEGVSSLAPGS